MYNSLGMYTLRIKYLCPPALLAALVRKCKAVLNFPRLHVTGTDSKIVCHDFAVAECSNLYLHYYNDIVHIHTYTYTREKERERERENVHIHEENIEVGYGCAFVTHGYCQIKSTT